MIIKTLSVLTALSFMVAPLNAASNLTTPLNVETDKSFTLPSDANIDTYQTSEGKTHNIIWLPHVEAPKMPDNPADLGKPGYFEAEVINQGGKNYYIYQKTFEPNKGYYDMNKMLTGDSTEDPLCYLSAAANMIYYWFDYNKDLILEYIDNINAGVYGNENKTIDITKAKWDKILEVPAPRRMNLLEGTMMRDSFLTTNALGAYYYRHDGYWSDRVVDFFINGYNRYEKGDGDLENSEDNFITDPFGGYFYPIFGNKRISKRIESSRYEVYSEEIAKNLLAGNALTLAYLNKANIAGAHALTIWGAEYDENNLLKRIYFTDSDDYDNNINNSDTARGLVGFDVINKDGSLFITTDPDAKKGAIPYQLYILENSREEFRARLNDHGKPESPIIIKDPKDVYNTPNNYQPNQLKIEAKTDDPHSFISYQWYKTDAIGKEAKPIKGAIKNTYVPAINDLGETYYYCVVTNHKNGYASSYQSPTIKSIVTNDTIDAQYPYNLSFNIDTNKKYEPYANMPTLKVYAQVDDGGTLSYQWYHRTYGTNDFGGGSKIPGATKSYLEPFNTPGKHFYYCEVTNTNEQANGRKQATSGTRTSIGLFVRDLNEDEIPAYDYAKEFLALNICGTNDNTPANSELFLSMAEKYNTLSNKSKALFTSKRGDETSDNPILKVLAKYDRIISLHGKDEVAFPDFMNRVGSEYFTLYYSPNNEIDQEMKFDAILFISMFLGIGVIGLFVGFIFKKKFSKER